MLTSLSIFRGGDGKTNSEPKSETEANDTIDTAAYKISAVNPTVPQSLVVPKGEYSIKVISVENGSKTVVYASDMIDFNNQDNVTMVLNKDDSTSFGYNLVKI